MGECHGGFQTEFPVTAPDLRANFVAQVIAWVRGMTNGAALLGPKAAQDIEDHSGHFFAPDGQDLTILHAVPQAGPGGMGVRYLSRDDPGRAWRAEALLRLPQRPEEPGLLRVRVECVAATPGASLRRPKKPYLINRYLADAQGAVDGMLKVQDDPHVFDAASPDFAAILAGQASHSLPVIVINVPAQRPAWLRHKLRRSAQQLGGLAHLVVAEGSGEPLAALCVLPGSGPQKTLCPDDFPNHADFWKELVPLAQHYRAQMPFGGMDWAELLQTASRIQISRARAENAEARELLRLYEEEAVALRLKLDQLSEGLAEAERARSAPASARASVRPHSAVPELWEGELTDRIRINLRKLLEGSGTESLHPRSRVLFEAFCELPDSPAFIRLKSDIERLKSAGNDRQPGMMREFLRGLGFSCRDSGTHIVFTPGAHHKGLGGLTIGKTPSDHAAPKNNVRDLRRQLGLRGD